LLRGRKEEKKEEGEGRRGHPAVRLMKKERYLILYLKGTSDGKKEKGWKKRKKGGKKERGNVHAPLAPLLTCR